MNYVKRQINGISIYVDTKSSNKVGLTKDTALITGNRFEKLLVHLYSLKNCYTPLIATIEITDRCNFNCEFCYIHEKDSMTTLNYETIIECVDFLVDKGLIYCVITGGECLLHKDFLKIYKYIKSKGVFVTVFTNGSLVTSEIVDVFKYYKPYRVEISIYSIDDFEFIQISKQKRIKATTILENIKKLTDEGINVVCKTPLNTKTKDSLEKIRDWCNQEGIDHYYSDIVIDAYRGESLQKYCLQDRKGYFRNGKEKVGNEIGYKQLLDCIAGKMYIYISADGFIRPCMKLNKIKSCNYNMVDLGIKDAYSLLQNLVIRKREAVVNGCNGCSQYLNCNECLYTEMLRISQNTQSEFRCSGICR